MTMNNDPAVGSSEKMTKAHESALERWRDYYRKNPKMLEGTSVLTPIMITKIMYDSEGRQESDFRYNVRERVKRGLVDLEFFIEVADKKDLNMVLNVETLTPLLRTLFWRPVLTMAKPDLKRAEIARLFIYWGFRYLLNKSTIAIPHYRNVVTEAEEFANNTVRLLRVEGGDGGGSDG